MIKVLVACLFLSSRDDLRCSSFLMNLKPTKRNLVVKFIQPSGNKIIVASAEMLAPTADDSQRTRVKVIVLSKELETEGELPIGAFILLRPGRLNLIPVGPDLVLIDASVIEAIVLDDKED